ncbi:EF-hand domain-containing protein [Kineosporia babensis]|uniref:EF-hand domain-containing protein n=1 Tax=Kineosporia babensis TaxID=499548 RepID=A0A9X1NDB3_9ACTN|nr:EF-hand domain-containing protein [Kineosporia babensis]MCD5311656.1 EF-hand domain-containing protein [Kineosporia babensis]
MSENADYQATFDLIDVDGDGLISAAELKGLMVALGAAEVTDEAALAALAAIDEDGDGLVSLPELADYLSENAPR